MTHLVLSVAVLYFLLFLFFYFFFELLHCFCDLKFRRKEVCLRNYLSASTAKPQRTIHFNLFQNFTTRLSENFFLLLQTNPTNKYMLN